MNESIDFDMISLNIRKRNYRYIGSGSGRRVYDLGDGYVVKVAKNNKGIAQNKAEHHISSSEHSNIFAKTIQVSEDFRMLIMVKAVRIRDLSEVRKYFNVKSNKELFQLNEIKSVCTSHNLILNDLYKTASWGMVNNCPVIIDYGFTHSVRVNYYSPFRFNLRF